MLASFFDRRRFGFSTWYCGRAFVVAVFAISATTAHAITILDTFGGPGETATGAFYGLGNTFDGEQSLAVPFELPSALTIDSVRTAITGNGVVSLSIVGNNAGSPPNGFGGDLGSPTGETFFAVMLTNPNGDILVSGLNVSLDAGRYWLVAQGTSSLFGFWQGGGNNVVYPSAFTQGQGWFVPFNQTDPIAAYITAVPEPAAFALMIAGLGFLAFAASGRRV